MEIVSSRSADIVPPSLRKCFAIRLDSVMERKDSAGKAVDSRRHCRLERRVMQQIDRTHRKFTDSGNEKAARSPSSTQSSPESHECTLFPPSENGIERDPERKLFPFRTLVPEHYPRPLLPSPRIKKITAPIAKQKGAAACFSSCYRCDGKMTGICRHFFSVVLRLYFNQA